MAKNLGYALPSETRGVSTAAVLAYLFINRGRERNRAGNLRQAILTVKFSDSARKTAAYAFVTELENEKPLPLRLWALEERTTEELEVLFEADPAEWPLQIPRTIQDTLKEFLESDPAFVQQLEDVITSIEERKSVFDGLWKEKREAIRSPIEDCVYLSTYCRCRLGKKLAHRESVAAGLEKSAKCVEEA